MSTIITSSDCAWMCDKLEDTQRKLGAITYGSHGSEISYLKLQAVLASHDLIYRLSQLQEHLSKREALVADAGEPDEVDLAVKAALERRMYAHSINVPCEEPDCALCKKRAAEQFDTSPQFAVGDTVRVDSIDAPECDGVKIKLGELIGKTVYIVSIRDFGGENYRVSLTQGEFGPGAWVKESDITLIAKGQA